MRCQQVSGHWVVQMLLISAYRMLYSSLSQRQKLLNITTEVLLGNAHMYHMRHAHVHCTVSY
jgi:hypothetical protein